MKKKLKEKISSWSKTDFDRLVKFAWDDYITFEEIAQKIGLTEQEVIEIMRKQLKASSFRLWRKRMNGNRSKHGNFLKHKIQIDKGEI